MRAPHRKVVTFVPDGRPRIVLAWVVLGNQPAREGVRPSAAELEERIAPRRTPRLCHIHGNAPMSSPPRLLGVPHSPAGPADSSPSLPAVLTRLGHACTGGCSAITADLDPVWFAWRRTTPGTALVVLDVAENGDAVPVRRLLHEVNACPSADRIRVVGRTSRARVLA